MGEQTSFGIKCDFSDLKCLFDKIKTVLVLLDNLEDTRMGSRIPCRPQGVHASESSQELRTSVEMSLMVLYQCVEQELTKT